MLEAHRDDRMEDADVEKLMSRRIKVSKLQWYLTWTPLELAAVMGAPFCVGEYPASVPKGMPTLQMVQNSSAQKLSLVGQSLQNLQQHPVA